MAKILVIDDEAPIRTLIRIALEHRGHQVAEAENGRVGVQKFRQDRADVVITDVIMPESEGFECILELRRLDSALRIICMSGGGRTGMNVLDVARRFGAHRTFAKPFHIDELVAAVEEESEQRPAA